MADYSIVVCTRDRPQLLTDLLPALLLEQQDGAEVVIVDSASRGAETRALVTATGLPYLRCDQPGASHARNAGLAATAAPVVLFTDDDCRPQPGWGPALCAAFEDDEVGFATGRVMPGAGEGRAMSPMIAEAPRRWTATDDVDAMGHGASMGCRRSALEGVGGFDEVLGAGGPLHASEDKDVFWRLLRAGWVGSYVPSAVVEHAAWRDHRESLRNGYRYGVGIGARVAKVTRVEGEPSTAAVLRRSLATLRLVGGEIRAGHHFGSVNLTLRAAGIIAGGLRARRYPVVDGRFAP
ncbi:MAG: glycosyltransferase [Actinomycetes bacterium]